MKSENNAKSLNSASTWFIVQIFFRPAVGKKRRKKKKNAAAAAVAAALAATQDVTMTSFENNNVFMTRRFMTQHKEENAEPEHGNTSSGANDGGSARNTPGAAGNTETVTVKNGKGLFTFSERKNEFTKKLSLCLCIFKQFSSFVFVFVSQSR